jgi:hypothetical protein
MYVQHLFGILYKPHTEWSKIKTENYSMTHVYLTHLIFLAAIPAVALLLGTTQIGWSFAGGNYVKLTMESAVPLALSFYAAMLVGIAFMSYTTYWMEKTFGADASFERCLTFVSFTATPMFLAGAVGLYPVLWLNVFVVLAAVCYSLYLLYIGVPIFMNIPEERGFIFASSILTVGLCTLVGLMAVTIILWSIGIEPQFVN